MIRSEAVRLGLIASLALGAWVGAGTSEAFAQSNRIETILTVTTSSAEAEPHFWGGFDDIENFFTSRAARRLEEALALDPDFGMAAFMHARYAPGLPRSERLDGMASALGVLANASPAELTLATGIREQFLGNMEAARALYDAAHAMVPDDPHVALYRALSVGAPASPRRLAALAEVREAHPDFPAAADVIAYTQWSMGDAVGARRSVSRYLELDLLHPNSHDSYAELFQFSGLFQDAIAHYEKALELDPTFPGGYTGLAEAYSLAGEGDRARAALERGVEHAGSSAAANNLIRARANTYLMEGDTRRGLETLKAAAFRFEQDDNRNLAAQVHEELAIAEALFGDPSAVHDHLASAVRYREPTPTHHASATIAHGLAGHAAAASSSAEAYGDTAGPADDFVFALRGYALLVEGRTGEARREARGEAQREARRLLVRSGIAGPWEMAFMALIERALGNEAAARRWEQSVMANNQHTAFNLNLAFSRLLVSN
jgi:tetratricopeptide (TPR) repeat protein